MVHSGSRRSPLRNKTLVYAFCLALIGVAQSGCSLDSLSRPPMTLELSSPAFQSGADIPKKYTCDGAGVSPALSWQSLPPNTKSLALIVTDADSLLGRFVHWTLYDIPPQLGGVPEGLPTQETLPNGAKQGLNGDAAVGYTGPCPPGTSAHRYVFAVYALDAALDLPPRPSKKQLAKAMQGHILAAGQLIGHYHR
jgi:Raf kinase inhibitor-like YbhB/YbcL family protein